LREYAAELSSGKDENPDQHKGIKMEILSKQHITEIVRYEHQFQYKTDPCFTGNFTFPVDENDNLLVETMRFNFDEALNNPDFIDFGVKEIRYTGTEPAIGICVCGAKVYLDESFQGVTECECGRWYYMDGTELKVTDQW